MSTRAAASNLPPQLLLRVSILVAIITIVLKTLAWWITDSMGLLSDAMESLVNLASAIFALVMVTIASRPADAEHPYGHHKAEYFSVRIRGPDDPGRGAGIIWAAVHAPDASAAARATGLGPALAVLSSAINGALAWAMLQSGRAAIARWRWKAMRATSSPTSGLRPAWSSGVGLVAFTGWTLAGPAGGDRSGAEHPARGRPR